MKNKTLYVNAEDSKVFEDAALLAGGSVSQLVISLLRDWVIKTDPKGATRRTLRKTRADIKSAGK